MAGTYEIDPSELDSPVIDRESYIDSIADKYQLDRDIFKKMGKVESGGNQAAVSPKDAMGWGQLMPDTAKELGVDPKDFYQNVDGSGKYLRKMLDKFNNNYTLAIAAYNAGPGAVEKYGGVPPYKETTEHVQKVLGAGAGNNTFEISPDELNSTFEISPDELTQDQERGFFSDSLQAMKAPFVGLNKAFAVPLQMGPILQRAADVETVQTGTGIPEGVNPIITPSGQPVSRIPLALSINAQIPGVRTAQEVAEAKERLQAPVSSHPMFQLGEAIRIDESKIPSDIRNSYFFQFAEQLGQWSGQIGTSLAAGPASPFLTAAQALGLETVGMYERGRNQGKSEEVSAEAAARAAPLGLIDVVGTYGLLGSFGKILKVPVGAGVNALASEAVKTKASNYLAKWAALSAKYPRTVFGMASMAENMAEESIQTFGEDEIAADAYGEVVNHLKSQAETAGLSAPVGFLGGALAMSLGIRLRNKALKGKVDSTETTTKPTKPEVGSPEYAAYAETIKAKKAEFAAKKEENLKTIAKVKRESFSDFDTAEQRLFTVTKENPDISFRLVKKKDGSFRVAGKITPFDPDVVLYGDAKPKPPSKADEVEGPGYVDPAVALDSLKFKTPAPQEAGAVVQEPTKNIPSFGEAVEARVQRKREELARKGQLINDLGTIEQETKIAIQALEEELGINFQVLETADGGFIFLPEHPQVQGNLEGRVVSGRTTPPTGPTTLESMIGLRSPGVRDFQTTVQESSRPELPPKMARMARKAEKKSAIRREALDRIENKIWPNRRGLDNAISYFNRLGYEVEPQQLPDGRWKVVRKSSEPSSYAQNLNKAETDNTLLREQYGTGRDSVIVDKFGNTTTQGAVDDSLVAQLRADLEARKGESYAQNLNKAEEEVSIPKPANDFISQRNQKIQELEGKSFNSRAEAQDSLSEYSLEADYEADYPNWKVSNVRPKGGRGTILKSSDPLELLGKALRQFAPKDVSGLGEFKRNWADETFSGLSKVISQGNYLTKDNPRLEPLFRAAMNKNEEVSTRQFEANERWRSVTKLSEEQEKKLWNSLWESEGEIIPEIGNTWYRQVAGQKNVYELDEAHYDKYHKWMVGKTGDTTIAEVATDVRRSLDQSLLDFWNGIAEITTEDNPTRKIVRQKVFSIPNYLPHSRYGKHVLVGRNKEGKKVVDIAYELPWFFPERVKRKILTDYKENRIKNELANNEEIKSLGVETWGWEKRTENDATAESLPMAVRMLRDVIDKAKSNLDPDLANSLEAALNPAIDQAVKARGDWGHFAKRKGVYGYETKDMRRVLWDYHNGLYATLAKMRLTHDLSMLSKGLDPKRPREKEWAKRFITSMLEKTSGVEKFSRGLAAFAAVKFLGLSVKPAVLNSLTAPIYGVARLMPETGKKGYKYWAKATADVRGYIERGVGLTDDEHALVMDLLKDGTAQAQSVKALKAEVLGSAQHKVSAATSKTIDLTLKLMTMSEKYSRVATAMAAFRAAKDGNISQRTADKYGLERGKQNALTPEFLEKAKEFVQEVVNDSHGIFGKVSRPEFARVGRIGKAVSSMYIFKNFQQNYIQMYLWLAKQGRLGNKDAYAGLVHGLLGTMLIGGLKGVLGIEAFREVYRKLFPKEWKIFGDDPLVTVREKLGKGGTKLMDAFEYGLGALANMDLSSSYSTELPDAFDDIFGVPASLVKDVAKISKGMSTKDYLKVSESLAPIKIISDMVKAYRLNTVGMTTSSGKPIAAPGESPYEPMKLTRWEQIQRIAGVPSLRVSKAWDVTKIRDELVTMRSNAQKKLADRYQVAINNGDVDELENVTNDWVNWIEFWAEKNRPEMIFDLKKSLKAREKADQGPRDFIGRTSELEEAYGF